MTQFLAHLVITAALLRLVANALMLMLAGALVPGSRVQGFGAALLGSLLFTLLNLGVAAIAAPR